jgi:hypothetical protein
MATAQQAGILILKFQPSTVVSATIGMSRNLNAALQHDRFFR